MFLQAVLGVSGWLATQAVHHFCVLLYPVPTPLMATILRNCHYLFIFLSAPLLNWQFLGVRTIFCIFVSWPATINS